jgi:DNA anti-recombination protein RmuC
MSDTKRKTFAFHQEDLDWINPLILEWAEENQDKEKGALITELLQDYRQTKEQTNQHQERAQRLQEGAARIAKPIQATLNPVRTLLGKALHKFTEKTDNLHLDSRLDAADHTIDATLTHAATNIHRLADKTTQKLRELRKPTE